MASRKAKRANAQPKDFLILQTKVVPGPRGLLVLNKGKRRPIPDDMVASLIAKKVIEDPNAEAVSEGDGASGGGGSGSGGSVDAPKFTATYKPVGKYEIAGPGLDEPLVITGDKAAAEAKIAELAKAAAGDGDDDDDAPAE